MLNQVILVGRLVDNPIVEEKENGRKLASIKLAVQRNFKNDKGIYETDILPIVLWDEIANNTYKYCKKGDLIGVKGRAQSVEIDTIEIITLVAEKITFLSKQYD